MKGPRGHGQRGAASGRPAKGGGAARLGPGFD